VHCGIIAFILVMFFKLHLITFGYVTVGAGLLHVSSNFEWMFLAMCVSMLV
jgi:hypothetical protein